MKEVEWRVFKLSEVPRECSFPSRSQVGVNMKGCIDIWVVPCRG